jgi:hypothetical protein
MKEHISARNWLKNSGYEDIAAMIDEIMAEWKAAGKHTRRNWWDILSGGVNGNPRTIDGREFPVLKAAQMRQGKPITKNAISNRKSKKVPSIESQNRWVNLGDEES